MNHLVLVNHYKKLLANKINAKAKIKIEAKIEDILENLSYLAEKNTSPDSENDESSYWIPLPIKRILLYIVFEGKAVIQTTLLNYKENEYAEAETKIVLGEELLSYHCKRICYSEVYPFAGYEPDRRNTLMVEMCKGSCETRAIYKAGIAMEFVGDIMDIIPDSDPNKKAPDNIRIPDNIVANLSTILEAEKDAEEPISDSDTEPKDFIIPFGKSAGKTLSEVSNDYKAYMMAFINEGVEKVSDEFKDALQKDLNPIFNLIEGKYHYYLKLAKKEKGNWIS